MNKQLVWLRPPHCFTANNLKTKTLILILHNIYYPILVGCNNKKQTEASELNGKPLQYRHPVVPWGCSTWWPTGFESQPFVGLLCPFQCWVVGILRLWLPFFSELAFALHLWFLALPLSLPSLLSTSPIVFSYFPLQSFSANNIFTSVITLKLTRNYINKY